MLATVATQHVQLSLPQFRIPPTLHQMRFSWENIGPTLVGAFLICLAAVALTKAWFRAITETTQLMLLLRLAQGTKQRLWFKTGKSREWKDFSSKNSDFCQKRRHYCGFLNELKVSALRTNVLVTLTHVEVRATAFRPGGEQFSEAKKLEYPVCFELSHTYWIGIELPPSPDDCHYDGRDDRSSLALGPYRTGFESNGGSSDRYYRFMATLTKLIPEKQP